MTRFSASLQFSLLCFLVPLLSSCLQTSLVYDMNTCQDGRTFGTKRVAAQIAFSETANFLTAYDSGTIDPDFHDWNLSAAGGLRVGVSPISDLGGNIIWGLDGTVGGRIYSKIRLNNPSERFAVAIMPALGYAAGTKDTDDETGSTLSSHMYAIELHVPMSYDVTRHFRWIFGGHLYYFLYKAPFTRGPNEHSFGSFTTSKTLICPAISGGLQIGPFCPEITLAQIDNKGRIFGGFAFNF